MPHASLTPLGRQLRVVLANLHPTTGPPSSTRASFEFVYRSSSNDSDYLYSLKKSASDSQYRSYYASRSAPSAATAVAEVPETESNNKNADGSYFRKINLISSTAWERATNIDNGYYSRKITQSRLAAQENADEVKLGYYTRKITPTRLSAQQRSKRRISNRAPLVDDIAEALKNTGRDDVAAVKVTAKRDLYSTKARSSGRPKEYAGPMNTIEKDETTSLTVTPMPTLEKILSSYIRDQASAGEIIQEERMSERAMGVRTMSSPNTLTAEHRAVLDAKGYNMDDVKAWADIILPADSFHAAQALAKRIKTHGAQSVPLSVLMYLLRRSYISARALRIIVQQSCAIMDHATGPSSQHRLTEDSIFLLFVRLVRRAREVWPRALSSLPEILLSNLHKLRRPTVNRKPLPVETLTQMLNKALRLMAIPTAFEPFKNNCFQEGGMVKILRFMSEHDPPLQTTREGYRAVILLQLAQRKRPKEQEWAELKTLSWPPWKSNRTAMDANITFDQHGVSNAAETLKQMRAAGYAHHAWERAASIYTGWDSDRTPTIQSLALLGTGGVRFRNGTAEWVARITTTRTSQEAWACFLAYEDKKLPPSQDVYLAVFNKLHKEEERIRMSGLNKGQCLSRAYGELFPGDTREVEPLPPSIHLYTYTRTPVPTVDGFYSQLRKRGIKFQSRCLAFLIENASSLQHGIDYLLDSGESPIHKQGLVNLDPSFDLSQVAMPLFTAFVKLLSRFSNVHLPPQLQPQASWQQLHPSLHDFLGRGLNAWHPLVRAVNLLVLRRPDFRPAWNAVLQALAKERSFQNISGVMQMTFRPSSGTLHLNPEHRDQQGAILAYRVMQKVLTLMRVGRLDLDIIGFQALCQSVENVAVGSWLTLNRERGLGSNQRAFIAEPALRQALEVIKAKPEERTKREFWTLVGDESGGITETHANENSNVAQTPGIQLPKLLEVPSPAVLHSYIRALGWMADYEGLLEVLRWMVRNQAELIERVERDRNGEVTMTRCIVAIRVFLERCWLPTNSKLLTPDIPSSMPSEHREETIIPIAGTTAELRRMLARLQTPASPDIVDEANRFVESVNAWAGWPDDDAVLEYCKDSRFQRFQ